jgi:hypothetical protein
MVVSGSFNNPATVKKYARHAQLGEDFRFDRSTLQSDGAAVALVDGLHRPAFLYYSSVIFGMVHVLFSVTYLRVLTKVLMNK